MSRHLCMSWLRQHIFLSYFKTPNVGPIQGLNPGPPTQQSGPLKCELITGAVTVGNQSNQDKGSVSLQSTNN